MPTVPNSIVDSAVYLYETTDDAAASAKFGGTGFIVMIRSEVFPKQWEYHYAVTNRHIAMNYPVVRVNTHDGKTEEFAFGPEDWEIHPDGYDIAALQIPLDGKRHKVGATLIDTFATEELVAKGKIAAGDDVFMVGRYVDHEGERQNMPSLRFGNISVMPSPMKHECSNKDLESYLIDLHSRTGYSGSPVFVYRTPGSDLNDLARGMVNLGQQSLYLLGIHWGQFPEYWKIIGGATGTKEIEIAAIAGNAEKEGEFVKGVSGITMVDPSWRVRELLMMEKFRKRRAEIDALLPEHFKKIGLVPEGEKK